MKYKLLILFLSLGLFINAQETTEYDTDIMHFIELNGTMNQYREGTTQLIDLLKQQYNSANVPTTVWEETQLKASQSLDALKIDLVTVYKKFFTHTEIKELVSLYDNKVAQKYINNVITITDASQDASFVWSNNLYNSLTDFLFEKGYKK